MNSAASPARPERRDETRFERIKLESHTDHIFVRIKDNKKTIQSEVLDLSLQGLCFRAKPALDFLRTGSTVKVSLLLGKREHALTLKIVNDRGPYVGSRIVESSPEWAAEVSDYLDPLEMGQRLYEVRPQAVPEGDPSSNLHWFRSEASCDLFYWLGPDEKVAKVQLVYGWQVVEWTPAYGFRTGQIGDSAGDASAGDPSALKEFELNLPADRKLVAAARRVVLAARVPEPIRKIFAK